MNKTLAPGVHPDRPRAGDCPSIAVVIVSYNSAPFIERCLSPLRFAQEAGAEIIVWDNCSTDRTCGIIEQNYPWVRLIKSPINLGYGRGNNAAAELTSAEYILFLNPDAFVPDWSSVLALLDYVHQHPNVAAVGPQLRNLDGTHQTGDAGWRPRLRSVAGHFLLIHRVVSAWPSLYLTNRNLLKQAVVPVDWICGACLLVRSSVFGDVGGFDRDTFMYGEDIELGMRLRDSGHQLAYLPTVAVTHIQGATQGSSGRNFYSTKWLDSLFKQLAAQSTAASVAGRFIAIFGYLVQGSLGWAVGLICRNAHLRQNAGHKLRYAVFLATPLAR